MPSAFQRYNWKDNQFTICREPFQDTRCGPQVSGYIKDDDPQVFVLQRCYIPKAQRGQGLATYILTTLHAQLMQMGINRIEATIHTDFPQDQQTAFEFFTRRGFRRVGDNRSGNPTLILDMEV